MRSEAFLHLNKHEAFSADLSTVRPCLLKVSHWLSRTVCKDKKLARLDPPQILF